jgi:hypothetical protein
MLAIIKGTFVILLPSQVTADVTWQPCAAAGHIAFASIIGIYGGIEHPLMDENAVHRPQSPSAENVWVDETSGQRTTFSLNGSSHLFLAPGSTRQEGMEKSGESRCRNLGLDHMAGRRKKNWFDLVG